MVNEETVNTVCLSRGMIKMSISTYPTWVTKDKKEGIELQSGIVKPFWNIEGRRDYTEATSEQVLKTISLIKEADGLKSEKTEEPKKEGKKDNLPVNNTAELPEFLTPALMTKWAKMNTTDRVLMFQQTPKDKVKSVVVGKEGNKDVFAPYVEGNYMFKEANAAFLFDWYIEILEVKVSVNGVSVRGTLYAWFGEYNKYLSRPATGYQELNKKVTSELALKGATTDAIKKGLSLFGFNSDVYSGERDV